MKVFISQPMRGLAGREIKLNRLRAIEYMCASDYDIKIIFEEGD